MSILFHFYYKNVLTFCTPCWFVLGFYPGALAKFLEPCLKGESIGALSSLIFDAKLWSDPTSEQTLPEYLASFFFLGQDFFDGLE